MSRWGWGLWDIKYGSHSALGKSGEAPSPSPSYFIFWGIKHIVVLYIFQRNVHYSLNFSLIWNTVWTNWGCPQRTTFHGRRHLAFLISFPSEELVLDSPHRFFSSSGSQNLVFPGGYREGREVSWRQLFADFYFSKISTHNIGYAECSWEKGGIFPKEKGINGLCFQGWFFSPSSAPREVRESPKGGIPDVPKKF